MPSARQTRLPQPGLAFLLGMRFRADGYWTSEQNLGMAAAVAERILVMVSGLPMIPFPRDAKESR